jgi:cephalosporin hydroxylase
LTPFSSTRDNSTNYPDVNYKAHISNLFSTFDLRMSDVAFIQGLSTDSHSIERAKNLSPFDCIYIDGAHDYETVVNDILSYGPFVATGGLLVMDDSANYLNIPDGLIRLNWRGIVDVSNAVRDYLEGDPSFEHIFSCGHNRVWRKSRQ